MSQTESVIRKFQTKDRGEVRQLVCDTALMGDSCNRFFKGEEVFADALSMSFTDYEPESSFVAEVNQKIVGYVLGSKDIPRLSKISGKTITPLIVKAIRQGVFVKKENIIFFGRCILSFLRGEFFGPDFIKEYPATLHINLKEEYRGLNTGAKLIQTYLDYLRESNVRGVHLATMSDKAGRFFAQNGFKLLFEGKRSYFRHILYKDIPLYIYGLKFKL
jgi:GNAT superfamily N-acetyltransferase